MLSFCDFNFVMKHFKFLKTITGKGVFNLFLASMFLVGNESVWGYLMTGAFAVLGLFFVLVGCACVEGYDDSDIKHEEVKDKAKSQLKKGKTNGEDTESHLLDSA